MPSVLTKKVLPSPPAPSTEDPEGRKVFGTEPTKRPPGGPRLYFVFDIETVPDIASLAAWLSPTADLDADGVLELWRQREPTLTMPKLPFHQVVAVAAAVIADDGRLEACRSFGDGEEPEAELLRRFFSFVESRQPRLVGWNSSGFDLPCLMYRALKHGLVLRSFYRQRGYRYRYNEETHLDLMDLLSGYGASTKVSLDQIAAVLGVPGKMGLDGTDVWPLYRQGRLDLIRAYCETDVLTTALIFARYAHHRGWFGDGERQNFERSVEAFLQERQEPHWRQFGAVWAARSPSS